MKAKPTTFALKLRELLDAQKPKPWKGNKLAVATGIPRMTIGRYLSGEDLPGLDYLLKIARALKVSLAVFDKIELPRKDESHA